MCRSLPLLVALLLLYGVAPPARAAPLAWTLLFEDTFTRWDDKKWAAQLGDGSQYGSWMKGWGNQEEQVYTNERANLRVEGGNLVISAVRKPNGNLTSARVRTLGRFAIAPSDTYKTIKVEARIKLPKGAGLWPAFWMLPYTDPTKNPDFLGGGDYGGWPASGEIDILEGRNEMMVAAGSLHWGGEWPSHEVAGWDSSLGGATSLADGFNTYTLEWEAGEMRWYLNGVRYWRYNSRATTGGSWGWYSSGPGAGPNPPPNAPFDKPFYIILNLALGGSYTGFVSKEVLAQTLASPKSMLVDYVRVWGAGESGRAAAGVKTVASARTAGLRQ